MTSQKLAEMLTSECAVTGLIGAFLLLAASYFVSVGIRFRQRPLGHSALYLAAGYLAGALIHRSGVEPGTLYCAAIGAGWPYLAISLREGGKVIAKTIKDRFRLGSEAGAHLFDESIRKAVGTGEGDD